MYANLQSEQKENVLKKIDALSDEIIEFARCLVKIRSENPPGEYEEISKYVASQFRALGFDVVDIVEVPEELLKKDVMGSVKKPRVNVVARMKGTVGSPVFVFGPHYDVVPPGPGWTVDPYSGLIKKYEGEDWLWGRGAKDAKGNIAAYTYAIVALKQIGIKLKGDAVIAAVCDEETGGALGNKYLLANGITQCDFFIPEGSTYEVSIVSGGVLHMKVKTIGKSAHASSPEEGIDALRPMLKIMEALYRYGDELKKKKTTIPGIKYPTLVIGTISGGTNVNVVPPECTIQVGRQITPEEITEDAEREIRAIVKEVQNKFPEAKFEVTHIFSAMPRKVPEDHPLVTTLVKNIKKVTGMNAQIIGSPGVDDARFYCAKGIPSVGWGSGPPPELRQETHSHGANEKNLIRAIIDSTKIAALTLMDLLDYE